MDEWEENKPIPHSEIKSSWAEVFSYKPFGDQFCSPEEAQTDSTGTIKDHTGTQILDLLSAEHISHTGNKSRQVHDTLPNHTETREGNDLIIVSKRKDFEEISNHWLESNSRPPSPGDCLIVHNKKEESHPDIKSLHNNTTHKPVVDDSFFCLLVKPTMQKLSECKKIKTPEIRDMKTHCCTPPNGNEVISASAESVGDNLHSILNQDNQNKRFRGILINDRVKDKRHLCDREAKIDLQESKQYHYCGRQAHIRNSYINEEELSITDSMLRSCNTWKGWFQFQLSLKQ